MRIKRLTDRAAHRIAKAGLWICGIALGLCLLAGAIDAAMESTLEFSFVRQVPNPGGLSDAEYAEGILAEWQDTYSGLCRLENDYVLYLESAPAPLEALLNEFDAWVYLLARVDPAQEEVHYTYYIGENAGIEYEIAKDVCPGALDLSAWQAWNG